MSAIFYKNLPYGAGGSNVEANPSGSATGDLTKLGIDGTVYDVTDADAVHSADKGVANGVASLDATGRVPSTQLPSYVDDVLEYASQSAFPATGESGKIYIALDTNKTYRWSGSAYVEISESLALGTTHSTAAYGDDAVSTAEPSFSEAGTRANLAGSGEKLSVILGKIKKWFTDLKDLAFIGKDGNNSKKYLRGDGTWQSMFEGSVVGDIQIKDNDSEFTTTIFAVNDSLTGLNLINVPDKSGTMAVTSDIVDAKNDLTVIAEKTDTDPYIYRHSVANGDRVREDIVGASVGWNQLAPTLNNWSTNEGTKTYDSSTGIATITPTNYSGNSTGIYKGYALVTGHKHLLVADVNPTNNVRMLFGSSSGDGRKLIDTTGGKWNTISCIVQATFTTCVLYGQVSAGGWSSGTIQVKNVMSIDLTTALGAVIADHIYALEQATAGAGVAFFRKYFTASYYPYNAGELLSVEVSGKKYVGFNQWDEEWEVGDINSSTGQNSANNNYVRATNYCKCLPNTTYFCKSADTVGLFWYASDSSYISFNAVSANGQVTSPSNACYFRLTTTKSTYNSNLCFNISKATGTPKNGDYLPYDAHTYTFPSQTLRGLFTLVDGELKASGDVYGDDGVITRKYGIVDLGSLSYNRSNFGSGYRFWSTISGIKMVNAVTVGNLACSKYVADTWVHVVQNTDAKTIAVRDSGDNIIISDDSYTDATAFKNSLNGVYLVYELATPTTEQSEPLTMPQICDKNGTEEFITTSIVPVGHESTYYNYPDYMESGEYKGFRDRVDSPVGKLSVVTHNNAFVWTEPDNTRSLSLWNDTVKPNWIPVSAYVNGYKCSVASKNDTTHYNWIVLMHNFDGSQATDLDFGDTVDVQVVYMSI